MKIKTILLAVALPLCATAQEQPTGIIVSGEASEHIDNDKAAFQITLESRGASPKEAREALHVQAKELQALLQDFPGVEKAKTIALTSNPILVHRPNLPPRTDGYTASVTTEVECPAEAAGDLAAQILEINPRQLAGPQFQISEAVQKSKALELLANATKDARAKADVLAKAAGLKAGDALLLETRTAWASQNPMPMQAMDGMLAGAMARDSAPPMPTESGQGTLKATVNARFELVNPAR